MSTARDMLVASYRLLQAPGRAVNTRRLLKRYQFTGSEHQDQSDSLLPYELRAMSQQGEDGVIAEVVRRVGAPGNYFVEFGVESGVESNCVFLAQRVGWQGLFMEADQRQFSRLRRRYRDNPRVQTAHAFVSEQNVESLFAEHGVPEEPDILAIDIDSHDYWVWRAINSHRPRIVVIEYNSALGTEDALVLPREHVAPWDGTIYFGASIKALIELGEQKGYRLVHTDRTGVNAFFVRHDLCERWAPDDVTVHPPRFGVRRRGARADRLNRPFVRPMDESDASD